MKKHTELETILYNALLLAKEHLEYCGYGDSWERECADASSLDKKIDSAIKSYEG